MMDRLLNVMLVLSLVGNFGLGLWLGRSESKEPEVSENLYRHRPPAPEERTRLIRSRAPKSSKANGDRRQLAVPWALAKESLGGPSRDRFEISQALISGLELTKEEKQAFDRAMVAFRSQLRESELAGLQESDDHIIRVVLDQDLQQSALGTFVKDLEQALPLSKAKILADASRARRGYLNWASFDLEVLDRKEGLYLKVSQRTALAAAGGKPVLRPTGSSWTNSLYSQELPNLRERWGHIIDFDPLEALMDQKLDE